MNEMNDKMTTIIKRLVGGIAIVSILCVIMFIVSANTETQRDEKIKASIEETIANHPSNMADLSRPTTTKVSVTATRQTMRTMKVLGRTMSYPATEIVTHSYRVPVTSRIKDPKLKSPVFKIPKVDTSILNHRLSNKRILKLPVINVDSTKNSTNNSIADVQVGDTIS